MDPAMKIMIWIVAIVILVANSILFIWTFLKRRKYGIHSMFIVNLTAAHILSGIYVLILGHRELHEQLSGSMLHSYHRNKLCYLAGFVGSLGLHASLMFLFLQVIDRAICLRNPFTVVGITDTVLTVTSSGVWAISGLFAIIPLFPAYYFHDNLYLDGELCLLTDTLYKQPSSWLYVCTLHFGFHGVLFIGCFVILAGTIIKVVCSQDSILTGQRYTEMHFFWKTLSLVIIDVVCWAPIIVISM